ncbi:MAG: HesA/MoeB/ThiF family protein, partial [Leptospiraceae bacterium]|nr:HesA/MoeB/ThiF family protein [Leptospiraceae bacterium]
YLAAAGVGQLQIIDSEKLEVSNLHRQILYTTSDVGQFKAEAAARRLQALNPQIQCAAVCAKIQAANIDQFLGDQDLILECSDSPRTKFLLNDYAVLHNRALLIGGAIGWHGQVWWIQANSGACYRCLFPQIPPADATPACASAGVMGPVVGLVACWMATLAMRYISAADNEHIKEPGLSLFDALGQPVMRSLNPGPARDCPLCGHEPTIHAILAENYELTQ